MTRRTEVECQRFGEVVMALPEGAAIQILVAEGWRRKKQEGKRRDELEDDCRRALETEQRERLKGSRVVLMERRRWAHKVVIKKRIGERRRGSP